MRRSRYVRLCAKADRRGPRRGPRRRAALPRSGCFYKPGERRRVSWYDDGDGGVVSVEHHYSGFDLRFEFGKEMVYSREGAEVESKE